MTEGLNPDQLLDRRRLRRKLTFWRISGLILFLALVITAIIKFSGTKLISNIYEEHVAEIIIDGFIFNDPAQMKLLQKLTDDQNVKAVIVHINSPGGTTTGGEILYEALRNLAEKKPTVAVIHGMGTSAAYMAAIATDQIFARRSSIVGSIGVIYQVPNIANLLEKLGIKIEEIKSSSLKAAPSPFQPESHEAQQVIQDLINDNYEWFLEIVMKRRGFDAKTVKTIGDGRIFSGTRALSLKLIDAIGGTEQAKFWLITHHNLPKTIPFKLWRKKDFEDKSSSTFIQIMSHIIVNILDLDTDTMSFMNVISKQVELDGLVSVWHDQ